MSKIKVTLSGGGLNGYQYIGMFYSFELNGFKPEQFTFYTSSIGSIIASFWLIGYTAKELMNIFIQNEFEPECSLIDLIEFGGLDNSNKFENIIKNIIYKKCNKQICLEDVPNIYIYGSNIIENNHDCFHQNSIELYKALCISACIPFIFPPIIYSKNFYVDSALMNNTPNYQNSDVICFFQKKSVSPISYKDLYQDINSNHKINFINYTLRLIECSYLNKEFKKENSKQNQLLFEFEKNFSSVDFWITKEDKINLIKIGYKYIHSNSDNYIPFFNKIIHPINENQNINE